MHLTISRAAIDEILAAAAASPDVEVCGLLLGQDMHVLSLRPCRNVAADPRDSFEIDPAVLVAAYRTARDGGDRPIGAYHSHPNGSIRPSVRDAAAAEPGSYWIIAGGGDLGCWYFETDGRFRAVSMVALEYP